MGSTIELWRVADARCVLVLGAEDPYILRLTQAGVVIREEPLSREDIGRTAAAWRATRGDDERDAVG